MEENPLRPIAQEVVYEDSEVRIWRQLIRAGETLDRHRHDHDYCLVHLSNGRGRATFHNNTGGPLGDGTDFEFEQRSADFVPAGHEETAINTGDSDYRAILIEFLKAP